MSTDPELTPESPEGGNSRWRELDELQREVTRRIKDNQRFLDGFLDDDYQEEGEADDDEDDNFEEL